MLIHTRQHYACCNAAAPIATPGQLIAVVAAARQEHPEFRLAVPELLGVCVRGSQVVVSYRHRPSAKQAATNPQEQLGHTIRCSVQPEEIRHLVIIPFRDMSR